MLATFASQWNIKSVGLEGANTVIKLSPLLSQTPPHIIPGIGLASSMLKPVLSFAPTTPTGAQL